jgi:hypothetical protein
LDSDDRHVTGLRLAGGHRVDTPSDVKAGRSPRVACRAAAHRENRSAGSCVCLHPRVSSPGSNPPSASKSIAIEPWGGAFRTGVDASATMRRRKAQQRTPQGRTQGGAKEACFRPAGRRITHSCEHLPCRAAACSQTSTHTQPPSVRCSRGPSGQLQSWVQPLLIGANSEQSRHDEPTLSFRKHIEV